MRRWTWIVGLVIVGCGSVRASVGNGAPVSDANEADAGPAKIGNDAAAPNPKAPARPGSTHVEAHACAMQFTGAYDGATSNGNAFAMMEENEVYLECAFQDGDKWNTVGLGIGNSLAPGAVTADLVIVDQSCPGGCSVYTSGPCTVNVEQIDPLGKKGLSATFSCASSGAPDGSVAITGSFDLEPPTPVVVSTDVDAGPPSCTLDVTGAYAAHVLGEGNNYQCYGDFQGTDFVASPSNGAGGLQVQGESWCEDCVSNYEAASGCTEDVILDEGVGGRFVATFACNALVALDGSEVSVAGKIDGLHVRPPE